MLGQAECVGIKKQGGAWLEVPDSVSEAGDSGPYEKDGN